MNLSIHNVIFNFGFHIIIILFGVLLSYGDKNIIQSVYYFYFSLLSAVILSRWCFYSYLPLSLLFFYISVCFIVNEYYGGFSVGIIGALYETNISECLEVLGSLGFRNIGLLSLFIILMSFWSKKLPFISVRTYIVIAIGGFLIFFVSLTSVIISVRNLGKEEASLYDGYDIGEMSMIFIKLLDENPFTRPLSSAYMFNSLREFHNSLPKESWNDVYPREKNRFSSEATIHVVVIGESANKDHFSVYGYNQPTMEDVKGLVAYDGVIAPSVVTRLSVPRILSKNETSLSYLAGKNIISLANKAGFDTYWISNQAKYGIFDTQVSRIASESKYSFYANLDFLSSKPDSILIPAFKETISKKSPNQKVIFLNTMGSHSDFCRRFNAEDAIVKTNRPPQFDCYDNSIKASFDFLLGLRDILDDSGSNYSIIYFSDHGLRMIEHPPYYVHDTTDKVLRSSVEIPFFVLDSMNRDKPSVTIKKNYNMRDFYATFSDWLDITSSEINLDKSIFLGHDSYQMSYEIIDVNLQKQNVQ